MNYINKMVKTTLLSAVVFGFVGCDDGACCDSEASKIKPSGYTVPDGTWEKSKIELVPKGEPIKPLSKEKPPVAKITIDDTDPDSIEFYKTTPCKIVELNAKYSDDPDGDNEKLRYDWRDLSGKSISSEKEFNYKFSPAGLYEVTLTVTDEQNLTDIDRVCILSGIEAVPLVADAGEDLVVTKDESVILSGRVVCARDDVYSYEWKENDKKVSDEATFKTSKLPIGEHTLKFIVTDLAGNKTCDKVKVTVK